MTVQRTVYPSPVDALTALMRSLVAYEPRYQRSSSDLYAQDQRGEMGDAADMIEWAGDYQHSLAAQGRTCTAACGSRTMTLEEYVANVFRLIQALAGVSVERDDRACRR